MENTILDHWLGRSTTALSTGANATVYVALLTIAYDDAWTPLATGECPGSTYARAAVTNSSANWTNSTAGSKQNKTAISFTTSAGADWGTIQSFVICDSNSTSAGNALFGADLSASQVIAAGNTVSFATGALVITLA